MGRLRTIAVAASLAMHVGAITLVLLLTQTSVDLGGGDTPMEVSLDPSAATGGNGPPIDAGPSEPPPQVAQATPQETPPPSEPPPTEAKAAPTEEEKAEEEQATPREATPPPQETKEAPLPPEATPPPSEPPPAEKAAPTEEEKAKEEQTRPAEAAPPQETKAAPPPPEATPPPQETKEAPPTVTEPPPPVIKSAPDAETPDVVADEPPPPPPPPKPLPPPPKPPPPRPPPPPKPLPPPPKPQPQPPKVHVETPAERQLRVQRDVERRRAEEQSRTQREVQRRRQEEQRRQQAISGGSAGGAPATGRVRTPKVGTAIDRRAQMTCAAGVRSRLRRPVGAPKRPFSVQIVVGSSGALLSARLGGSSGAPALDQAALAAVRGSAPFPPCPGIGGSLPITIPFR